MIVPHEHGSKTVRIKFQKLDDLESKELPEQSKKMMPLIVEKEEVKKEPTEQTNEAFKNAA
jgi:hypothetical protein